MSVMIITYCVWDMSIRIRIFISLCVTYHLWFLVVTDGIYDTIGLEPRVNESRGDREVFMILAWIVCERRPWVIEHMPKWMPAMHWGVMEDSPWVTCGMNYVWICIAVYICWWVYIVYTYIVLYRFCHALLLVLVFMLVIHALRFYILRILRGFL